MNDTSEPPALVPDVDLNCADNPVFSPGVNTLNLGSMALYWKFLDTNMFLPPVVFSFVKLTCEFPDCLIPLPADR